MTTEELLMDERFSDSVVFGEDGKEYLSAVIGYTKHNNIVYDYELMVDDLAKRYVLDGVAEDEAYESAIEWIDYNTLRAIPYAQGIKPIVASYDFDEDEYINVLTGDAVVFTEF